jgi:hypothetical protein
MGEKGRRRWGWEHGGSIGSLVLLHRELFRVEESFLPKYGICLK